MRCGGRIGRKPIDDAPWGPTWNGCDPTPGRPLFDEPAFGPQRPKPIVCTSCVNGAMRMPGGIQISMSCGSSTLPRWCTNDAVIRSSGGSAVDDLLQRRIPLCPILEHLPRAFLCSDGSDQRRWIAAVGTLRMSTPSSVEGSETLVGRPDGPEAEEGQPLRAGSVGVAHTPRNEERRPGAERRSVEVQLAAEDESDAMHVDDPGLDAEVRRDPDLHELRHVDIAGKVHERRSRPLFGRQPHHLVGHLGLGERLCFERDQPSLVARHEASRRHCHSSRSISISLP